MRENRFIHQNKQNWEECENLLQQKKPDPGRLSQVFIQVTDDLAFARTFYPNRLIRVYLNQLARQLYGQFQQSKSKRKSPFRQFWTEELPLTIYQSRTAFLISFLTFTLAMIIGIFSYSQDSDFARVILGDAYVSMTEENIESGEPMKVYKEGQPTSMFLSITLNNLKVALLTFVSGALFGVACIGLLLSNGIMVGTFQYFFVEKGLFKASFLTIWQHGTLEISAIIIAGAAGLVMSQGLIFPGTYNRLQAFRITALRGLKIFLGTIPLFIMAAFIEGFITRFTGLPDFVLLSTILASLAFVLTYFVWYPRKVALSRGLPKIPTGYQIPSQNPFQLVFYRIKSAGQVSNDAIQYMRQNSRFFFRLTVVIAILQVLIIRFIWHPLANSGAFIDEAYSLWYLGNLQQPSFLLIIGFGIVVLAWLTQSYLQQSFISKTNQGYSVGLIKTGKRHFLGYFVLIALSLSLLLISSGWGYVLFLLSIIPVGVCLFTGLHDQEDAIYGLSQGFGYIANGKSITLQFFLILLFIGSLSYFLLNTTLAYFYAEFIAWNIPEGAYWGSALMDMILLFTRILVFNLAMVLAWIGSGLLASSLKEASDAPDLLNRIQRMKA